MTERRLIEYKAGDPPGDIAVGWRMLGTDHDGSTYKVAEVLPDNLMVEQSGPAGSENLKMPLGRGRTFVFEEPSLNK